MKGFRGLATHLREDNTQLRAEVAWMLGCDGDQWLAMMHTKGLAPATINLRIRSIIAFFGWAVERHLASQRLKIKRITAQHKLPRVLNVQQEQALFERLAGLSTTAPTR